MNPLAILIADSERVRLRSLQWWLTRLGHRVTAMTSVEATAAGASSAHDLRLLDPRLLVVPWLADDDTPGVIWSTHTHRVSPGNPGHRVATHCPCPASPEAVVRLLHYVLHPETADYLDAAMVGELLGAPRTSPTVLVARFVEDASALATRLRDDLARADLPAASAALHTLRGCAAAVGARGLLRALAPLDFSPGDTRVPPIDHPAFDAALQATARSLRRALEVYGDSLARTAGS